MTYPIYRVVQPPGVIRWPSLGTTSTPSTAKHARFLRWDVWTPQTKVIRWDSYGSRQITPVTVATDQASNWQANYWKNKSKADRENEAMLERIRLGILPAPQQSAAEEAIREAHAASVEVAAGRAEPEAAIFQQMAAREAYEQAYQQAYREAYIAEAVAERWREDMKRITRRRKAAMLLLH